MLRSVEQPPTIMTVFSALGGKVEMMTIDAEYAVQHHPEHWSLTPFSAPPSEDTVHAFRHRRRRSAAGPIQQDDHPHFRLDVTLRTGSFGNTEMSERIALANVLRNAANMIGSGGPISALTCADRHEIGRMSFGPGMILGGADDDFDCSAMKLKPNNASNF